MKYVTIVVPECKVNLNTVSGAYEILNRANDYWQKMGNKPKLEIKIAGFISESKIDDGYFTLHPTDINKIPQTDLLLIPSIFEDYGKAIACNKALIDWIGLQYKGGAEIASMCSGAFLLAATGLLDGKSCSMHWNTVDGFKRMFPNVKVAEEQIITAENGIYTNGGGYSFLNLMLYLVEKIFDRPTAIFCSKVFQIDIGRTSQSPFFIFQMQKAHGDELISEAQTYIEENVNQKISFEELASKLAISRRNFDRRFIKATGNTPVEYLQRVKVEVAKKALEKGRKSIFEVMDEVGYSDDKSFREIFKRMTGLSPVDYKTKYNTGAHLNA